MIAVLMVWVVESGIPKWEAVIIAAPEPVSAAKPCWGSSFDSLTPMVFIILQPPIDVPTPITLAHKNITQEGIVNSFVAPLKNSARENAPINFWPSYSHRASFP